MPPISVLIKPASSRCNMLCDYCFYRDEAASRSVPSYGMMSENTLKNVIRKTLPKADGCASYAFQGGEPTLSGIGFFEKVISLQNQYNKNHIPVSNSLQTNGYALDESWCRFLHDHKFLVGLSVDGTEAIHDTWRHDLAGNGTYARIRRAAALMDQFQVDYNILTVVTADVAANIQAIYALYKSLGWHYQQYIPCLEPLGDNREPGACFLSPVQYGQFLIDLFHLWYQDLQKGTQPYIRTFENFAAIAAGYVPESCEYHGVCGLQYVVEADGSVYPCDFYALDEYRLGNFNTDRLDSIDRLREAVHFISRSKQISAECLSCPHYSLCRCGCRRNRIPLPASEGDTNRLCEGYRMFFDACADRIRTLARDL